MFEFGYPVFHNIGKVIQDDMLATLGSCGPSYRQYFKEHIFCNIAFFKFIYIIIYYSHYSPINFLMKQHQNDVICISECLAINFIYTQSNPARPETSNNFCVCD